MSDSGQDPFLKDLQLQCLKDSVDRLSLSREQIHLLPTQTLDVLTNLIKNCHSLKGDLQAAGFVPCGDYVHKIESSLVSVQSQITSNKYTPSEQDIKVFEFFIVQVFQYLEEYLNDIQANNMVDDPKYSKNRVDAIDMLLMWKPSEPEVQESEPKVETPIPVAEPVAQKIVAVENNKVDTPVAKKEIQKPEVVLNKYLLMESENRNLALPVEKVVEVVQMQKWNKLPEKQNNLLGLLNFHGEVIPIFGFKNSIAINDEVDTKSKYIIVAKKGNEKFGFPIESAKQIVELDFSKFYPAEKLVGVSFSNAVTHFALHGDGTILILDVEKVLVA